MKIQSNPDNSITITNGAVGSLLGGFACMAVGVGVIVAVIVFSKQAEGNTMAAYLFGGIFALVGLVISLTAASTKIVLRKGGESTISSHRIIGGKRTAQSFQTADVVSVRLLTGRVMNGSGDPEMQQNERRSVLSLVLKDNSLVELASKATGGGLSVNGMQVGNLIQKAPLSSEAQQIADYLGVGLEAADTSNPIALIRQAGQVIGQTIAAQQTRAGSVAPSSTTTGSFSQPAPGNGQVQPSDNRRLS